MSKNGKQHGNGSGEPGTIEQSAAPPPDETRRRRSIDPLYEYCVGHNFAYVTGTVIRPPRISGRRMREFVWFRMQVPDPDHPGVNCFISVRARADLGYSIWENIGVGDQVAVVGRLQTGRRPDQDQIGKKQFIYLVAYRVSGSFPVQLDRDRRYMRIRTDLWNRVASLLGDTDLIAVPPRVRRDLLELFGKKAGWVDDVEEEVGDDQPDPEPSSDPEPEP